MKKPRPSHVHGGPLVGFDIALKSSPFARCFARIRLYTSGWDGVVVPDEGDGDSFR
jgi:hypothetical protein